MKRTYSNPSPFVATAATAASTIGTPPSPSPLAVLPEERRERNREPDCGQGRQDHQDGAAAAKLGVRECSHRISASSASTVSVDICSADEAAAHARGSVSITGSAEHAIEAVQAALGAVAVSASASASTSTSRSSDPLGAAGAGRGSNEDKETAVVAEDAVAVLKSLHASMQLLVAWKPHPQWVDGFQRELFRLAEWTAASLRLFRASRELRQVRAQAALVLRLLAQAAHRMAFFGIFKASGDRKNVVDGLEKLYFFVQACVPQMVADLAPDFNDLSHHQQHPNPSAGELNRARANANAHIKVSSKVTASTPAPAPPLTAVGAPRLDDAHSNRNGVAADAKTAVVSDEELSVLDRPGGWARGSFREMEAALRVFHAGTRQREIAAVLQWACGSPEQIHALRLPNDRISHALAIDERAAGACVRAYPSEEKGSVANGVCGDVGKRSAAAGGSPVGGGTAATDSSGGGGGGGSGGPCSLSSSGGGSSGPSSLSSSGGGGGGSGPGSLSSGMDMCATTCDLRLLAVLGPAGCGTTVLAAALWQRLRACGQLVAAFVVSPFEALSRDPRRAACGLAFQLASHPAFAAYRAALTRASHWDKVLAALAEWDRYSPSRLLSLLVVQPLARAATAPPGFSAERKAVLLIDGLHEFEARDGGSGVVEMLDLLDVSSIKGLPDYMGLLVTGRSMHACALGPSASCSSSCSRSCMHVCTGVGLGLDLAAHFRLRCGNPVLELLPSSPLVQEDVRSYLKFRLRLQLGDTGVVGPAAAAKERELEQEAALLAPKTQFSFLRAYLATCVPSTDLLALPLQTSTKHSASGIGVRDIISCIPHSKAAIAKPMAHCDASRPAMSVSGTAAGGGDHSLSTDDSLSARALSTLIASAREDANGHVDVLDCEYSSAFQRLAALCDDGDASSSDIRLTQKVDVRCLL